MKIVFLAIKLIFLAIKIVFLAIKLIFLVIKIVFLVMKLIFLARKIACIVLLAASNCPKAGIVMLLHSFSDRFCLRGKINKSKPSANCNIALFFIGIG
jgi:hypothetical protein